jgi:hypothetical protein
VTFLSFPFMMRPRSTVGFKLDLDDLELKALDAIRDVLWQHMPLLDEKTRTGTTTDADHSLRDQRKKARCSP